MKINNIGIIGLGYVGLTFSIALAKKGFKVFGYEKNNKIFESLNKGKAQFYEENIDRYLKKTLKSKKFKIFKNLDNINQCNYVFITIGTPITKNKKASQNNIISLAKQLKSKLNKGTILGLRSNVKLGTTRKLQKILNSNDVKLAMCPERTAEGSALKEINTLPQIIGSDNSKVNKKLKLIFSKLTKSVIIFNSFEEAEVLKLIDNSYRDTIFGFANELAEIGENYNINILNVINKISISYPRTKINLPGTVGGPCLTKDSRILYESVKKKMDLNIVKSSRKINEQLPLKILDMIKKRQKKNKIQKILFCGLAFKGFPQTSDIRGSMSKDIIEYCEKIFKGVKIYGIDNLVSTVDAKKISSKLNFNKNLSQKLNNFDIILILNNSPVWKNIGIEKFLNILNKNGIIFDYWSSFKTTKIQDKYFKLGEGNLTKKFNHV